MFQLILLSAVCITIISCTISSPKEPSEDVNSVKKQRNHTQLPTTKSFLMDKYSYMQLISSNKKTMASAYNQQDPYDFDSMCPSQVMTGPNDPPNKRSTCPWFYSFKHNPKRHTATIINSEHLCEYSIGSNKSMECVPVTYKIPKLQLQIHQNDNDNYIWTETTVTVVIGYTSADKRTDYSSNTHIKAEVFVCLFWVLRHIDTL
jgi:hypothetical protein